MRAPCVVMLGLGQGVGLACARKFAESKWSVMIVDGDQKNLDRAEKDLGEFAHYLHEDQFTRLGLKNALSGTLEQFEGVDVVLNIPPIPAQTALEDMTIELMSSLFQKGAMTSLLAAKVFAAEMKRELAWEDEQLERPQYDKSFITILSRAAVSSDEHELAASVAQGAVFSTVKALSIELAPYKIRSNAMIAIRPRAEDNEPWIKARTPLGRSSRPGELADTAFFLASPEARFITGQGLVLDGGRSYLNGMMGTE
jgi:NAD(P)-dependent dehydrogenase (short-subunit alcohol dehydrogenase family)